MTDGELLQTLSEGGLVPEAKQILSEEIHRRNLSPSDPPNHQPSEKEQLRHEAQERWFPLARTGSLGFSLYGRNYLTPEDQEENIQVRTKFFVFAYIPLIPIASYRFKYRGRAGWFQWDTVERPLNRVPIVWTQVLMTWLKTFLWICGTVSAVFLYESLRQR